MIYSAILFALVTICVFRLELVNGYALSGILAVLFYVFFWFTPTVAGMLIWRFIHV